MAKKKTKTKPSRLAELLLETAGDMRKSGLLDSAAYEKITLRHLGSEKRAKGRTHNHNRMAEN
jgi:hypothetical protein